MVAEACRVLRFLVAAPLFGFRNGEAMQEPIASQEAISLHWGDPPLAGSLGLRAVCVVRMAQSSRTSGKDWGPGLISL